MIRIFEKFVMQVDDRSPCSSCCIDTVYDTCVALVSPCHCHCQLLGEQPDCIHDAAYKAFEAFYMFMTDMKVASADTSIFVRSPIDNTGNTDKVVS